MPGAFADYLVSLNACEEAVEWVGDRDLATAWEECDRADWMLWLLEKRIGKRGWPSHRDVVRLACDCAERALRFVPQGEDRPRLAIEAARRWADEPTEKNRKAASAAASAAYAAAYAAASAAADAAASAAYAAADAAASAAADAAASAAAYAAYAAADAAAYAAEHRAMCDLIRKAVPRLPDWKKGA